MEIKSIGLKSDLMFLEWTSDIKDRGEYLKIETIDNPKYFWGNLLVFNRPPQASDYLHWIEIFKTEFSKNPEIEHITFTWDIFGSKPDLSLFLENGFNKEEVIVLTCSEIKKQFDNNSIQLKKIETNEEWEQVINLQFQTGIETDGYLPEKYRPFIQQKFEHYKKLIDNGHGEWFGAFQSGVLVSDLGLFGNKEFMRFQSIETKTSHRKQGIAQNLIEFASHQLISENYIIQALHDGPAIDMYMKIGFNIKEVLTGVCLYNVKNWKK